MDTKHDARPVGIARPNPANDEPSTVRKAKSPRPPTLISPPPRSERSRKFAGTKVTSCCCWPTPGYGSANWPVSMPMISTSPRRTRVRRSITRVGASWSKATRSRQPGAGRSRSPNAPYRFCRSVWRAADRANRRSRPPWTRDWAWRTASAQWSGTTRSPSSARPKLRVHDLRHNYASFARRAGPAPVAENDGPRLDHRHRPQHADLYDNGPEDVASALDDR